MFNEQFFNETICNTFSKTVSFLYKISLPVINNDFFKFCQNNLTEDEILIPLKSAQNNKTPGKNFLKLSGMNMFF